jgi:hypothetical protein
MNMRWTTFFDIFTINVQKSDSDKNQDVDDECGTFLLSLHSEEMLHWGKNTNLCFQTDRWDSVCTFTPLICLCYHPYSSSTSGFKQAVGAHGWHNTMNRLPKFWVSQLVIHENIRSTLTDTTWTSAAVKASYFTLIVCIVRGR